MSELDVQRLNPEILRQKTALRVAIWASVGLNVFLWGIFIFVPTAEMLGYAIVGPLVAIVLLVVTFNSGKLLQQDLKNKMKEVIKGQIQLKSSYEFRNSTAYEFIIDGSKYPVTLSIYTSFNELDEVILERTQFGKIVLSCEKLTD